MSTAQNSFIRSRCHRVARCRPALLSVAFVAPLVGLLSVNALPDKKAMSGEEVFRKHCTSCHGANGGGTKLYAKPLTGVRSVENLTAFIHKSMPPRAPAKLPLADARKVADYIYGAFYSPLAQARSKAARIELSHLTVRQYRNAVADLVASFRPGTPIDEKRGLHGEYFKAGRFRRGERVLERVDPEIRFDLGTTGALPEQADPYQFCMSWDGSVLAPDTGEYEFIVRTEHAVRLWVNDLKQPLLDAYVKSGDGNEYRGTVYLLGGRAYPLRLEFSKGVQGVNDLSKIKQKPPTKATLSLEWRPPKRTPEVIPQRNLSPITVPEVFASAAAFPPDDRSMGFERASSVSKAWEEGTTEAAIETAGYVASHLDELLGLAVPTRREGPASGNPSDLNREDAPASGPAADRAAKLRDFCKRFATRAFRRPLTPDLEQRYIERQFKEAPDLESAVKRVVLLTLKSPRFLYREVGGNGRDPFDTASRLAFALWDTIPDDELMKAASEGQLATREQVTKQAERMIGDRRAWMKLREFLLQWLKVDQYPDLAKDPKRYPGFDEAVASDLRASLEIFLEQVVWNEKSDFRELLLTDKLVLNGRLAKMYGAKLAEDAPFQPVELDLQERAGVLTHPYLLASFAYIDSSSPIHRGVLLARSLLGRTLQPPPQAFTPVPASLHPNLTTRQRVALQTRPAACMSCHSMINPLGFTLEKFDAIGRLRAEENGKPVDSTGSYELRTGEKVTFKGVRDLARFLSQSKEAHGAFVEKLFQYMVKQPVQAYGKKAAAELQDAFETNQFSIRKQMVETAVATALLPSAGAARTSVSRINR